MRRRAVGASFTRLPLNLLADLSASAPCALVERDPVCGRLYGSAASSREEVVGNGSRALRAFLTRPTTWAGSCSAALNGACAASWLTIKRSAVEIAQVPLGNDDHESKRETSPACRPRRSTKNTRQTDTGDTLHGHMRLRRPITVGHNDCDAHYGSADQSAADDCQSQNDDDFLPGSVFAARSLRRVPSHRDALAKPLRNPFDLSLRFGQVGVPQPEFCRVRVFRNYLILLAHRAGFDPKKPFVFRVKLRLCRD